MFLIPRATHAQNISVGLLNAWFNEEKTNRAKLYFYSAQFFFKLYIVYQTFLKNT